jgi:signal transduction histidine kinase
MSWYSLRRRTPVALAMAGLYQVAFVGCYLQWYRQYPFWAAWLWALTEFAAVVAWGMCIRARRQLIASLRERAEQAEAAQRLLAEQARHAERTRIAREMHDVLAHRVSLMAPRATRHAHRSHPCRTSPGWSTSPGGPE